MTPFEKKLSQVPRREVPADWRDEILANARTAKPDRERVPFGRRLLGGLADWMGPYHYLWGGLAALWMMILILNFSGPRGETLYAVAPLGVKDMKISSKFYASYVRSWEILAAIESKASTPADVKLRNL